MLATKSGAPLIRGWRRQSPSATRFLMAIGQAPQRKMQTGASEFKAIEDFARMQTAWARQQPEDPTAPRSPWQNGHAERLIGSIRRECLDHVVVFGERHLRRLLRSYMQYYNDARTHLSLSKDAPIPRAVQVIGRILPTPILGGLHYHYVRI
jgi:hypothetical protein